MKKLWRPIDCYPSLDALVVLMLLTSNGKNVQKNLNGAAMGKKAKLRSSSSVSCPILDESITLAMPSAVPRMIYEQCPHESYQIERVVIPCFARAARIGSPSNCRFKANPQTREAFIYATVLIKAGDEITYFVRQA